MVPIYPLPIILKDRLLVKYQGHLAICSLPTFLWAMGAISTNGDYYTTVWVLNIISGNAGMLCYVHCAQAEFCLLYTKSLALSYGVHILCIIASATCGNKFCCHSVACTQFWNCSQQQSHSKYCVQEWKHFILSCRIAMEIMSPKMETKHNMGTLL